METARSDRAHDPVENPVHYKRLRHEPIVVMEALGLGPQFHLASALKYVARAGHKGAALEDLSKALWCVGRAVEYYSPAPLQMTKAEVDAVLQDWGLSANLSAAVQHLIGGTWVAAHLLLSMEIEQLKHAASSLADGHAAR